MTPELKPSRSLVEARTMLIGKPTLVVKVSISLIGSSFLSLSLTLKCNNLS